MSDRRIRPAVLLSAALLSCCIAPSALGQGGGCAEEGLSRSYLFREVLPAQPAPAQGVVKAFLFDNLPAYAWKASVQPALRVRVSGDLGLLSESLYIRIAQGPWTPLAFPSEGDCSVPAECGVVWVSPDLIVTGAVLVEIVASPGVSGADCPDGFTEVGFEFSAEHDHDCNGNRRDDACEILEGLLTDCDLNLVPDSCQIAVLPETDCNGNGVPDCCDFNAGATDIDTNGRLDACEIAEDPARDCDGNGVLDRWQIYALGEPDLDRNAILDSCDVAAGRLADCDEDGIPDLAELLAGASDENGDYIVDGCSAASPDLYVDGFVNSVDIAVLLSLWQGNDLRGDLNRDGLVSGADIAILLSAWGPVGFCGDGIADARENCCNCPIDVQCGEGLDCFYGACLPCPSGDCPGAGRDTCMTLTGDRPPLHYSGTVDICAPQYGKSFFCGYGEYGFARHNGFSPSVIAPELSRPTVAFASFGLLTLLVVPGRLLRRAMPRIRR